MHYFKKIAFILSTWILVGSFAGSMDLEMTGPEYLKFLDRRPLNRTNAEIDKILDIGKRNLDWFKLINANRPANEQLPLYLPELQQGIPMDKPREYNESTVLADYAALEAQFPEAFSNVLLTDVELPVTHPLESDAAYLEWTRKMDRVYQSASRWTIMEPNLWSLASRSYGDIRGYYYLAQEANLESSLDNWASLAQDMKDQYSTWLVLICHNNNKEKAACRTELDRASAQNTVKTFYTRYNDGAKRKYDAYFALRNPRSDVVWNATNPLLTLIPFLRPASLEVQNWLVDNIEDEWKWNDWKLKLDFTENSNGTTNIVFEAGATPHVNGLGGSQITMDANAPLQDYGSKWTIRHEYGHVLGLPDCYIEFYDTDREIIINYQIDLDNLMCSRKGKLQEKHYLELKKHYYTQN